MKLPKNLYIVEVTRHDPFNNGEAAVFPLASANEKNVILSPSKAECKRRIWEHAGRPHLSCIKYKYKIKSVNLKISLDK